VGDPRRSWLRHQAASAQLDNDSPVGPHRSAAPPSATRELLVVVLVTASRYMVLACSSTPA